MKSRIIEFDPEAANEAFDSLPGVGDEFNSSHFGKTIIVGIDIINQSKLVLKVTPKRDVKRFEDFTDYSMEWDNLPERFLRKPKENDFVEEESLSIHNHD